MAEYIDRQELYQTESLLRTDIVTENRIASYILDQVLFDIQAKPAADVVPVVRCIVCRHGIPLQHSDYVECKIKGRMPKDGFCSYGERKEK